MRRLHRSSPAAAFVYFGLLAIGIIAIGGCNSDPHDTHVHSGIHAAR
jgi:hypothetical protein